MEKTNQQAPTYPPQYQQTPGQPQPPQAQYVPQQSTPITSAPGPQAPMYVAPAVFGEFPQPITCINCKQQGVSMTEKVMGAAGWVAVFDVPIAECLLEPKR
ncbi:hypothetical protein HDV04_001156 [Boothiomyces sp. JEL0838]|nr:hypothetical protein HDV04_001156 [Boothiomyces sp. JEL0838]